MGKIEIGKSGYLNKSCWLVRNLNYPPYKRCQYCELKFRKCLFLHYQVISLILILFFFILFIIAGNTSTLVIISIFTLIIVYGYFFNKSTDKIIRANFAQRQANKALEKLNKNMEDIIESQTKEIKDKNISLEKTLKQNQQLSEIKSEFLRIVNHQLRTPTSILKSMLSMLVEGTIEGKKKRDEAIGKLYISSERLERILDDLLNAQSLVGKEVSPDLKPCHIEEILDELIPEFISLIKERGLSLKFNKPKEKLPIMLLDRDYIKTALEKLIDNAILYNLEKGSIIIDAKLIKKEDNKQYLQISVKDTGAGIPEEDKERLFKIFSRGKHAEGMHPNGSGLGLYIVKEYIKAHQGTINVHSEGENKGTEFIIVLPIVTEV